MITAVKPEVDLTARYRTSETCRILGISPNTLRKYTEKGLIKCGFRKVNAQRYYEGKEILRFWKAQL